MRRQAVTVASFNTVPVSRLLKPGGRFVSITYGSPKTRMHCFTDCQLHWDALLYTITKPNNGTSDESADQAPVVEGPFEPEVSLILM